MSTWKGRQKIGKRRFSSRIKDFAISISRGVSTYLLTYRKPIIEIMMGETILKYCSTQYYMIQTIIYMSALLWRVLLSRAVGRSENRGARIICSLGWKGLTDLQNSLAIRPTDTTPLQFRQVYFLFWSTNHCTVQNY